VPEEQSSGNCGAACPKRAKKGKGGGGGGGSGRKYWKRFLAVRRRRRRGRCPQGEIDANRQKRLKKVGGNFFRPATCPGGGVMREGKERSLSKEEIDELKTTPKGY